MKQLIEFDRLEAVLRDYGEAIAERYKENLKASDRVATGDLVGSIKSEVSFNGSTFEVELSMLKYYDYIEHGTGVFHQPDKRQPYKIGRIGHENILKWVKVKGLIPRFESSLPMDKQYDRIAWAVQGKIEKEGGMKGKPDLERALTETEVWEQRIEDALDEDVLDCLEELIAF